MQKDITARHFDLTAEMKERCEAEMEGLTRFFDGIISCELVLDKEKHRRMAEIKVKVYDKTLAAAADSNDIYASLAMAIDKLKGQLIKYKGKLKDKNPDAIHEAISAVTQPDTDVDGLDN